MVTISAFMCHVFALITSGSHWWKGAIPIFMVSEMMRKFLANTNDMKYITDAPACTRQYFIVFCVLVCVIEKSGSNPKSDSSSPIHVKNQLFDDDVMTIEKKRIIIYAAVAGQILYIEAAWWLF